MRWFSREGSHRTGASAEVGLNWAVGKGVRGWEWEARSSEASAACV